MSLRTCEPDGNATSVEDYANLFYSVHMLIKAAANNNTKSLPKNSPFWVMDISFI